jgi:DNA-binding transcriptional LysR family regulator
VTSLGLFEEKLIIISKKEIDLKKIHESTWLTYAESDFFFDIYKKHSSRIIRVASMTSIIRLVKESVGVAIVPAHTVKKEDRLYSYDVKGLKRPKIFMNTLNYQTYPSHLELLIKIIQKNI